MLPPKQRSAQAAITPVEAYELSRVVSCGIFNGSHGYNGCAQHDSLLAFRSAADAKHHISCGPCLGHLNSGCYIAIGYQPDAAPNVTAFLNNVCTRNNSFSVEYWYQTQVCKVSQPYKRVPWWRGLSRITTVTCVNKDRLITCETSSLSDASCSCSDALHHDSIAVHNTVET